MHIKMFKLGSKSTDDSSKEAVISLVNASIRLFLSGPKSPRSDENEDEIPIIFNELKNGRLFCPLPGCSKNFSHIMGLKYHLQNKCHEVVSFLEWLTVKSQDERISLEILSYITKDEECPDLIEEHPEVVLLPEFVNIIKKTAFHKAWPLVVRPIWLQEPGSSRKSQGSVILGYPKGSIYENILKNDPIYAEESTERAVRPKRSCKIKHYQLSDSPEGNESEGIAGNDYAPSERLRPRKRHKVKEVSTFPVVQVESSRKSYYHKSVYDCLSDYEFLSEQEAQNYLPHRKVVNLELGSRIHNLHFGDHILKNEKIILNSGGSVWAMDSCVSDECIYLAVGGYRGNSEEHHKIYPQKEFLKNEDVGLNQIQIWNMSNLIKNNKQSHSVLEIVILHEYGPVFDLTWIKDYQFSKTPRDEIYGFPLLGLMAVSLGDGSMRIIRVPTPESLRSYAKTSSRIYIHLKNVFCKAEVLETMLSRVCWAGENILVTGCTNGFLAFWNLRDVLVNGSKDRNVKLIPMDYFRVHSLSVLRICAIDWKACLDSICDPSLRSQAINSAPTIISSGADGAVIMRSLSNIRLGHNVSRVKDFVHDVQALPESGFVIFSDSNNDLRVLSLTLKAPRDKLTENSDDSDTFSEEFQSLSVRCNRYFNMPAHTWSIGSLPKSNCISIASADGSLLTIPICRKKYPPKLDASKRSYVYILEYDSGRNVFAFRHRDIPNLSQYRNKLLLEPPETAIQKTILVKGHDNEEYIASGCTGGLISLDMFNSRTS